MATITQNGITFNDVYKDGGTKHEDTIIQSTYNSSYSTPSSLNFPLVNAVDIDWDGAVLEGANLKNNTDVTLKTSGQLLKLIEDIQKEIYVLSAAVIALGSN